MTGGCFMRTSVTLGPKNAIPAPTTAGRLDERDRGPRLDPGEVNLDRPERSLPRRERGRGSRPGVHAWSR